MQSVSEAPTVKKRKFLRRPKNLNNRRVNLVVTDDGTLVELKLKNWLELTSKMERDAARKCANHLLAMCDYYDPEVRA